MQEFDFTVFLSYRGNSEGKEFSCNLYKYLTQDPLYREKYGKVYYSPYTKSVEVNFKKDVPKIMSTVKYFVMPLTENYYEDFWDEEKNCPNKDSITYIEIQAAIQNHCRFICIKFPDFVIDADLIKKIFGENSDELLCVAPLEYDKANEQYIFHTISEVLTKQKAPERTSFLSDLTPNIFLSFKDETEDKTKYPLYEKLHDVTKITLLNFASSAFIAGIDVASTYEESNDLKSWFDYNLVNGNIEADIILVNPHSYAAQDAALYKMYPAGQKVEKSNIILTNMNKLFTFIHKYPKAKLNVYLTDIALPYGVMLTEHKNKANNHIKVDLYAPVTNDDKMRPSFYMLQSNPQTKSLYSFFEGNIKNIMNNYAFRYTGHPETKWLLSKNIIHRGVIHSNLTAHTKEAYDACLEANYPIEVDLLPISDGTVVVGRQNEVIICDGTEKKLGACTKRDLRIHNSKAGNRRVFTLEEFLEYINGRVPVLLEIKRSTPGNPEATNDYVKKILKIVQTHLRQDTYYGAPAYKTALHKLAFHSSDPYILKMIKDIDCMIPCGLISMDFSRIKNEVGEEFCKLHAEQAYFRVFSPDFISFNVLDLDVRIKQLCDEHNIPLLGWTVRDEDTQQQAIDYGCDNIIIEGRKTYL